MALRNRSSLRNGPKWLAKAGDIRFVDHGGNGTSVLYFEAPTLKEAAQELYEQGEFWPSRPDGDDTGFDLLGDVLADVTATNDDSDHFDPALLKRLLRFARFFKGPFQEIDLTSRRYDAHHPARITAATLETVRAFLGETPAPRRVRLVGRLDMIRVSTQTFAVRLDTGEDIPGVLADGTIDQAKTLLDRRVLILGKAIFRASGRVLRINADSIMLGEGEPSLWSRVPKAGAFSLDSDKLRKPQGPRSGMAAILGKWPGNETEEELQASLERLS